MNDINNRKELIQESIDRKQAILNDCPNLRNWNDTKELYIKLHPDFKQEENINLFPKNFNEIKSSTEYNTIITNQEILNEIFNTNCFINGNNIKINLQYQSYDGMPVGTLNIYSNNEHFNNLDTYSDKDIINNIIKSLNNDDNNNTQDISIYEKKLSEQYAFKIWNNYGQCLTYYKAIDMGTETIFDSYESMEELENSMISLIN